MWCHGTVAELLGEAGLCRCARMPDAAYVQVTDCYWRILLKKSKIERLRKSREGRLLDLSAAARLFKTNRTVRGCVGLNRCGPSHRRAWNASAVQKNLGRRPKRTFSTISAESGR
jgi:hypothetical protein